MGILWVVIILGGNFPGWELPGWELSWAGIFWVEIVGVGVILGRSFPREGIFQVEVVLWESS